MNELLDLNFKNIEKTYYDNGVLKSEVIHFQDKQIVKIYFENGNLQAISNLKNFKLNGESIVYYRNGNIHCKINYLNHQQHGLTRGYYRNGKKSIEILYEHGKAISGAYFKKNGFKIIMSEKQLQRESE